jgi:hypothetical protein
MNGIQQIAAKGRYGDNRLLHVSDGELQGLNALAREKFGQNLTTNPETGLPEAFLFAPLLAPMLASAVPALAGMGAVGTGLAAAGLGTAEAAARGMDDPLERGLMAGLTAGAGSALGSSLGNVADPAAAVTPPTPDVSSAVASGTPDVSQALASAPPASYNTLAPGDVLPGTPTYNMPAGPNGISVENLSTPFDPTLGTTTQGGSPFGSTFESYKKAGVGMKNLLSDPSGEALGTFVSQNKLPLAGTAIGLGGQAQLDANQQMREQYDRMQADKEAELEKTRSGIRQSYANVGRAMPTNPYTGRPIFASGGLIGLMEGGRPFDKTPAQKYADGGSVAPRYVMNSRGEQIAVTPGSTSNEVGGKGGRVFGQLFSQLFNQLSPEITQNAATNNAPAARHDAFVGKLQSGMGNQTALAELEKEGYYNGGYLQTGGRVGDGMSDDIPAMIDGDQPAALSDGEFVIPADVVSHLGNGSSDAGAQQLYGMMDRIRQARTGTTEQGKEINAKKMMPA